MSSAERGLSNEERLVKENKEYKERLAKEDKEHRDLLAKERTLSDKKISRREALIKIAAGLVVVAGVGGYFKGSENERGQLILPGDLTRDRLAKLKKGDLTFVHRPNGETVETIRNADVSISPFPLPEEQARIEQAVSLHEWMAVNPLKLFLGKGGEDVKALEKLVANESLRQQKLLGSDIKVASGEVIDWVGLDHEHQIRTGGEDLITEGLIVMTGTKIGDNVVGISRDVPGGPLGFIVIDVSAPPPDGLRAAGIVVAK